MTILSQVNSFVKCFFHFFQIFFSIGFHADFPESLRESFLLRTLGIVHDKGNDSRRVGAAVEKELYLVVDVFGILAGPAGSDDHKVLGSLHFFPLLVAQLARLHAVPVKEDRAELGRQFAVLPGRLCRQAVGLQLLFPPIV